MSQLTPNELRQIGSEAFDKGCSSCRALLCNGWEAMPSTFEEASLRMVGTLRQVDPEAGEPTLDEYHPQRTSYWSENAPIAPNYFPYNRCDVWVCCGCRRAFLRYTEYGGYYVEQRIRLLDPRHVVDTA
ncbi:MAG TPA: hypothetical protein VLJ57_15250 [Burkholderiaceae bacterium]|nr:hypothetical protein [Burkholderiaceae bacterium]